MLIIYHPPTYLSERAYIFATLLADFLGLEYTLQEEARTDIRIVQQGDTDGELVLNDTLFQTPKESWLAADSLPQVPLQWAEDPELRSLIGHDSVPVIYGRRLPNGAYLSGSYWNNADSNGPRPAGEPSEGSTGNEPNSEGSSSTRRLGLDVFGSAFFMLTRYEEWVSPERDDRERFTAKSSLAFRAGFLRRPVVNEYVEILWAGLSALWPQLRRKPRSYRAYLSHDVDWVYGVAKSSFARVFKQSLGDVVRRRDVGVAWRRVLSFVRVKLGNPEADLYNTFDFIMSISEQAGLKSAFYFIPAHTGEGDIDSDRQIDRDREGGVDVDRQIDRDVDVDCDYHLTDPWVRRLMRRIYHRGHEIGLHTSYHTFRDGDQIRAEFQTLREAAEAEGIVQAEWGGRQHYLRFEASTTWQGWESAGLTYDSTLSFADGAGYRAGVCYSYHPFDLRTRQVLRLRERPLIVMEGSLFDPGYMGLTTQQARATVFDLIAQCRRYQGDFTLLWHNSSLVAKRDRTLYKEVVERCRDNPTVG